MTWRTGLILLGDVLLAAAANFPLAMVLDRSQAQVFRLGPTRTL